MTDYADQVPRKERFEALHPNVQFIPPCRHEPNWIAEITSPGGGDPERIAAATELRQLLDGLENLDGIVNWDKRTA